MSEKPVPFQLAWWSFGLPRYRDHAHTYLCVSADSLPPLPTDSFHGELQWLESLEDSIDRIMREYRNPHASEMRCRERLQRVWEEADALGLRLPDSFVTLMGSLDLQNRIPSCTACFFDLDTRIVNSPGEDDRYLVRFLNDQQGCVYWYLYLEIQGELGVLASPLALHEPDWEDYLRSLRKSDPDVTLSDFVHWCAPSFEEFIYRFWIENKIWFALVEESVPLTMEQARYLSHYAR